MNAPLPSIAHFAERSPLKIAQQFGGLKQPQTEWLFSAGVSVTAISRDAYGNPRCIRRANGVRAPDGRFDIDPTGPDWIVFEEPEDVVFWQPRTSQFATWNGKAIAVGEAAIDNPATCSFDCSLNIFNDPLDWLRNNRDGVHVFNWRRAFDRLRDVQSVIIDEPVLARYQTAMRPARLPEVFVRRDQKTRAAA